MKMGDPGYFEAEARHDATTARMRSNTKDAVAFYFAVEALHNIGIDLPADLNYSAQYDKFRKTLAKIGTFVTKARGLTISDASPELKKSLVKESKEVRDMSIGAEYFSKIMKQQRERVSDKDVAHVNYRDNYTQGVNIGEIIKKIKARENRTPPAIQMKGIDITD